MDDDFPFRTQTPARRRTPWRAIAVTVLGAFLLGGLSAWLALRPGELAVPALVSVKGDDAAPAAGLAGAGIAEDKEFVAHEDGLDRRIADMEQRLARLDVQAGAAAGNAARAE